MKRTRKGFTLVELLIVIAIVGVLATMMSLTAGSSTAKAKATQIVSDFKVITSGLSIYIAENTGVTDPTAFNTSSPDYIGGKMGGYEVTKVENDGWYVATRGNLPDSVAEALATASSDLGMIGTGTGGTGGVKLRIHK